MLRHPSARRIEQVTRGDLPVSVTVLADDQSASFSDVMEAPAHLLARQAEPDGIADGAAKGEPRRPDGREAAMVPAPQPRVQDRR